MTRRAHISAFAVGAILVAAACTQEDIILGSVPAGGSTTDAATGARCISNEQCGQGSFCERDACTTTAAGVCQPTAPTSRCEKFGEHLVCGCDGVTYFNDCLRRYYGVSRLQDGACDANAKLCNNTGDPDEQCPQNAACAFLDFGGPAGSCNDVARGHCWATPADCHPDAKSSRWDECDPLGQRCVSICDAVRNQKAYFLRKSSLCP